MQVFFCWKSNFFQNPADRPEILSISSTRGTICGILSSSASRRKGRFFICGQTKAYSIRSIPWASAGPPGRTMASRPAASAKLGTGRSTSAAWGRTPCISAPSLRATATATTPGTTAGSTAVWAPMRTSPESATASTATGSKWCWTGCSTMWAGASGPSGTYRSGSGTPPTRTGSTSISTATPITTTASGTRAGRATMSW